MNDLSAIAKKRSNSDGINYAFRGIDQFYNALHPLFAKHGLFTTPIAEEKEVYFYDKESTYKGISKLVRWTNVHAKISFVFYAADGSSLKLGPIIAEGLDNSDKASNKAMSAAHKYALMQIFIVPTEDIAEADEETPEIETKNTPPNKTVVNKQAPGPVVGASPAPSKGSTTGPISDAQMKRLFAIQNKANWTKQDLFGYLSKVGIKTPSEITWGNKYDAICKYIENNPFHPDNLKDIPS